MYVCMHVWIYLLPLAFFLSFILGLIYLSIYLSVCLSVCLSVGLLFYLPTVMLSIHLPMYLAICLRSMHLPIYLAIRLAFYLSYLSICPSTYVPTYLSIHLASYLSFYLSGVGHLKRMCEDAFRVAGAVQETWSSEMLGGQSADFWDGWHFGASDLQVC